MGVICFSTQHTGNVSEAVMDANDRYVSLNQWSEMANRKAESNLFQSKFSVTDNPLKNLFPGTGNKIKIDGDHASVGISLTNEATKEMPLIAKTAVLVNDPSKITFVVSAGLASGDYKLTITTRIHLQYNHRRASFFLSIMY